MINPKGTEEQQSAGTELFVKEVNRIKSLVFLEDITPPIPPLLYYFHPVSFVENSEESYNYYVDSDGFIQDVGIIKDSVRRAERGTISKINAIVLHRTDSPDLTSAKNTAKTGVAAHFLVDKDGSIYQIASLFKYTYHVGNIRPRCERNGAIHYKDIYNEYKYSDAIKMISDIEKSKLYPDRYPMNSDSVGIEVVAKCLSRSKNGRQATWEDATGPQRDSIKKLIKILQREYKLNDENIYQHQYISYKTHGEGYGLYPIADTNNNVDSKL